MNRKLWIIAIIFMLAVIGTANAQQYDPESDFETVIYPFQIKYVIIKGYKGSKNEVRIPPKIQGLPVWEIGKKAFEKRNITSIIIPESISRIRNSAFKDCTKLTSINLTKGIKNIETGAFTGCSNLTVINVDVDNKDYMSDNGVLYDKKKTVLHTYPEGKTNSSFVIPDSITKIEYEAFYLSKLASITIPNSVKQIEEYAFQDCVNLTSITVPKSVTHIGQGAFEGCDNLISVTFQGTIDKEYFGYKHPYDYSGFEDVYEEGDSPFPGDLKEKFYATNKTIGTPGTYTRASGGTTWTRK